MEKHELRLVLKTRGRHQVWYIRNTALLKGRDKSTGFKLADKAKAEEDLEAKRAAATSRPATGSSFGKVPVDQVLTWELERRRPPSGASQKDWNRFSSTRSSFDALRSFWAHHAVGDIGSATWQQYVDSRTKQRSKRGDGNVSKASAITELNLLKTAVRRFGRAHGLPGIPQMPVLRNDPTGGVELKRSDVVRLLLATRGYEWDAEAKRMRRRRGRSWGVVRAKRRHLARLILLAIYTASECSCLIRLRWRGDPDSDVSFVDLGPGDPDSDMRLEDLFPQDPRPPAPEEGADEERPPQEPTGDEAGSKRPRIPVFPPVLLYRLGPDRASGKLGGMPIKVNTRIAAHLRRWRRLDGPSGPSVVFSELGQPLSKLPATSFREIRADAGLSSEVTLGDLRRSSGMILARREDVTPRSAAVLMAMRTSDWLDQFSELDPDHQARAVAALEARPAGLERFRAGG